MVVSRAPARAARRAFVACTLAALLAAPALADWNSTGGGAARTGQAAGSGPATSDVAYDVRLPGTPFWDLVIEDGVAFVSVIARNLTHGPESSGLYAIDLDTGATRQVVALPAELDTGFLVEGIYLAWQQGRPALSAYDLEGEFLWKVEPSLPDVGVGGARPNAWWYMDFLVADGLLIVAVRWNYSNVLIALDPETGTEPWMWLRDGAVGGSGGAAGGSLPDPYANAYWVGLAAADGRVFAWMPDVTWTNCAGLGVPGIPPECASVGDVQVWALAADTGQVLWNARSTSKAGVSAFGQQPLDRPQWPIYGVVPAVGPTAVYLRLDELVGLNAANGNVIWRVEAGQADQFQTGDLFAYGIGDTGIFAATLQTLYRLDPGGGQAVWQRTRLGEQSDSDTWYFLIPIATTATTGFVGTGFVPPGAGVYGNVTAMGIEAFSLATGEPLWEWRRDWDPPGAPAYGGYAVDGALLVATHNDGVVTVIGKTNASVGFPALDDAYRMEPGAPLSFDLAGGAPGLTGPATSYRVEWGDGDVGEWTPQPSFAHTYDEGEYTARLQVRNDAGHSASRFVTVTVAPLPPSAILEGSPVKPSVFADPFHPDNQDMTFGVLGILLAVAGGIFGVWRARRHRRLLHEELGALQTAHRESEGNEGGWQDIVSASKDRWQGLHRGGKLTDSHVALLGRRADELTRARRVGAIEAELSFLPHGLVKTLQKMLQDGRITAIEKDAVVHAVDEDDTMTAVQKKRVLARVGSWVEPGG